MVRTIGMDIKRLLPWQASCFLRSVCLIFQKALSLPQNRTGFENDDYVFDQSLTTTRKTYLSLWQAASQRTHPSHLAINTHKLHIILTQFSQHRLHIGHLRQTFLNCSTSHGLSAQTQTQKLRKFYVLTWHQKHTSRATYSCTTYRMKLQQTLELE